MKSSTNYAGLPWCRSLTARRFSSRDRSRARRHSQTRCEQPGIRCGAFRCSRFEPLDVLPGDVAELDHFDIVICVSGHAARFALDRFDAPRQRHPDLTWIAVGSATARVLAERGIDALRPANESSEGILALSPLSRVVGQRVLICAGRGGRPLLEEELTRRGARVTSLALYERIPVPAESVASRFDSGAIGAVIVSSADGARALAPAWQRQAEIRASPSLRLRRALRRNWRISGFYA